MIWLCLSNSRWGTTLRARYISSGVSISTLDTTNNVSPSYVHYNLGLRFRVPIGSIPGMELYAKFNKLFDKDHLVGSLFSPYADVIGRYYMSGARINF